MINKSTVYLFYSSKCFIWIHYNYIYLIILDLLHMTTKQMNNAVDDLKPAVEALLHAEFADGTTSRIDTDTQSTQTPKEVI